MNGVSERRIICQRPDLERLLEFLESEGFHVEDQERQAPQSPDEISTIIVTCVKIEPAFGGPIKEGTHKAGWNSME